MPLDDDADDDVGGLGGPLHPDDRLWRHPSELGASLPAVAPASPGGRSASWPVALVAGLVGAALCGGALAATGSLTTEARQRTVEKVAVTPVVSSPLVNGERGVAAVVEHTSPSIARLSVRTSAGTGRATALVWRDDGMLLTSAHEVAGATEITVVLHDGRRLVGALLGADLPTDVAIVAVDARDLAVAVLGSSANLAMGSPTVAVGSPARPGDPGLNTGVVSALERRLDVAGTSLHGLIQTDSPIETSWSGGPLLDSTGAVVGISTDMAGTSTMFGYAIPIDLVRRVADQLLSSGKVTHGWIGIQGSDLSDDDADAMDLAGGALIRGVTSDSPAARSGLSPDDVITSVGDHDVMSSSGLVVAVRNHQPGDVVVVRFWRDGRRHQATVIIDEHP